MDFVDRNDGFTALHHAVLSGFEDTVEELIASGADINAVSLLSFSPLSLAALKARRNIVEQLLNRRALLLVKEHGSSPLLHMACCSGDLSLVRTLFQKAAVREQLDLKAHIQLRKVAEFEMMPHAGEVLDGYLRPLHVAAFFGRTEVVEFLLDTRGVDETFEVTFEVAWEETADTNLKHRTVQESKWTAMMAAARNGHPDIVSTLLARGADPTGETYSTADDFESETALTMAACKGHASCLLHLVRWHDKHKLPLETAERTGAIHTAAFEGHVECVRILLDHGSDVNHRDGHGDTPLTNAASKEHVGVIELLSQYKADLNAKSQDGSTALIWASFKGHAQSIETLVRLGADVKLKDRRGQSACHFAATNGHCRCVERLARAGSDLNAIDLYEETPLMLAAQSGHTCSVETLLSLGPSTSKINDSGWTAAHLAAKNGHSNCIEALAKFGADLNAVGDRSLKTPLISAAGNGHYSCLKTILSYEPRSYLFVVPGSGFTGIHFAAWQGHVECVRLLLQHGADLNGRSDSGLTPLDCLTSNQKLERKQRSECEEVLKTMGARTGSALLTQNRPLVDLSMTSQRAQSRENAPKPSSYRRYFSTK